MHENSRDIAFHIIYEIVENNAYSNLLINKYIQKKDIPENDKNLIVRLVYGTIQNKMMLDYILGKHSNIKLKNISTSVLNILRMSIYQKVFMDNIPDYAIINESVNLIKKYANERAAGFGNAVLRKIIEDKTEYIDDSSLDLSIRYSFPEWIINIIRKQIGEDEIENYLESTHEKPELMIRANTLKTSVEDLYKKLEENDYDPKTINGIPEAIAVLNPSGIFDSEIYKSGLFSIQDLGAMIVVDLLDPKPGDVLIDVCAAPGGKSMFAAERMKNRGTIYSFDFHIHKIKLINEGINRLGIKIIEASLVNAEESNEKYIGIADKIIVDVPCSGFGVIRRKPEIKFRVKGEDIDSLQILQQKILLNSSKYLKSGGKLLYCTCTLNKKENQNIIDDFLKENNEFKQIGESRILLPHINETDGFFIVLLERG